MNDTEFKHALKTALKMSPAQLDYMMAKHKYDVMKSKVDAEKALIPPSDLTIADNWTPYTEIENKYNYYQVVDSLRDAEKELVDWAGKTLREKFPCRYTEVKRCFEKPIYQPELRRKFIDLCYHLEAI